MKAMTGALLRRLESECDGCDGECPCEVGGWRFGWCASAFDAATGRTGPLSGDSEGGTGTR